MNKKFILFYSKSNDFSNLETLLLEIINIEKKLVKANCIIYTYNNSNDIKEAFLSYISDLLLPIKMYEAKTFKNFDSLNSHIEYIYELYNEDESRFSIYENHKTIINKLLKTNIKHLRKQFLGKYNDDSLMIQTLKSFFMTNQNISKAAKTLFIHRNTLLQRLDKFTEETNLDPKIFLEAILIYELIK